MAGEVRGGSRRRSPGRGVGLRVQGARALRVPGDGEQPPPVVRREAEPEGPPLGRGRPPPTHPGGPAVSMIEDPCHPPAVAVGPCAPQRSDARRSVALPPWVPGGGVRAGHRGGGVGPGCRTAAVSARTPAPRTWGRGKGGQRVGMAPTPAPGATDCRWGEATSVVGGVIFPIGGGSLPIRRIEEGAGMGAPRCPSGPLDSVGWKEGPDTFQWDGNRGPSQHWLGP